MLEQIASAQNRNDEQPNIALAQQLAQTQDKAGIAEIVSGLGMDSATAGDCVKVLYELGARKPELIAPYADVFLDLLASKNNRLVWGAMTALACIAPIDPAPVLARLDDVRAAYRRGSVITVDNSISVFAALCAADRRAGEQILPLLLQHLAGCRAKEVPQHLERMAPCFTAENAARFRAVVQGRYGELSAPQRARVDKVMKRM